MPINEPSYAPRNVPIVAVAANYTLTAGDNNRAVESTSSSAVTITIPPNSAVPFSVGAVVEIVQYGSGQVTVAGGTGVNLRTAGTLTTRAQYSTLSLRQRALDEWIVAGDST